MSHLPEKKTVSVETEAGTVKIKPLTFGAWLDIQTKSKQNQARAPILQIIKSVVECPWPNTELEWNRIKPSIGQKVFLATAALNNAEKHDPSPGNDSTTAGDRPRVARVRATPGGDGPGIPGGARE
jgi:hypothetical protein